MVEFILFFLLSTSCSAKVLIITHQCHKPEFIELQYKTFKKFLSDEYEYVVFNDASDNRLSKEIDSICLDYGIRSIKVPQELHSSVYAPVPKYNPQTHVAVRHSVVIEYSLKKLAFDHDDIILMIDSDMLLVRPLNIKEYMKSIDIAALIRPMFGINFIWPGLVFLNIPNLPDRENLSFNILCMNNFELDTGAATYFYLRDHPEINFKKISMIQGYELFCPHPSVRQMLDEIKLASGYKGNLCFRTAKTFANMGLF